MSGIIDPQAWLIMVWHYHYRKILPKRFRRRTQTLKKNPEGSCYRAQALKEESQRDSVEQLAHGRYRNT